MFSIIFVIGFIVLIIYWIGKQNKDNNKRPYKQNTTNKNRWIKNPQTTKEVDKYNDYWGVDYTDDFNGK